MPDVECERTADAAYNIKSPTEKNKVFGVDVIATTKDVAIAVIMVEVTLNS